MSNSVNNHVFNPFTEVLAADERLRLKDGVLTVEKSSHRTEMNAWTRFWTRGQYSQSSILKEMGKLYKKAQEQIGEDEKRDTFLNNFETLKGRATAQNEAFKDTNSIVRFFEAKSFIDVTSPTERIQKIDTEILTQAENNRQRQAQEEQRILDDARRREEEMAAAQERMANETRMREQANQARENQRIAEREARVQPIRDNIGLLTKELEELENCPLDVFIQNEFDRLVAEGGDPVTTREALDHFGQEQYEDKIFMSKNKLELAESTLNALLS